MSYKNKKKQKGFVNQLKRKIGLIRTALLKKIKLLNQKTKIRMQQYQTRKITQWLREKAKQTQSNNLKINDWVGDYIEDCIVNGKSVEILTQLCISKGLEVRYEKQGNQFIPTKNERKVFIEEIPMILNELRENGIRANWYLTFNRFWLDVGRIDNEIEQSFCSMIRDLLGEAGVTDILVLNWEDDFLKARPVPNAYVQQHVTSLVLPEAYDRALKLYAGWVDWYKKERGLIYSDEQVKNDLDFQFGCVAEEGRLLTSPESLFPNGQFILIPLERPESYDFFDLLVPDFKKRIVPILKPYPWRLE